MTEEKQEREHVRRDGVPRPGYAPVTITCPFCGWDSATYLWSLAGSGKRCVNKDCRAKHTSFGISIEGKMR